MKDINELIEETFQDKKNQLDFLSSQTYSRLADELLLLRKKRGVTQKQLAEMVGTTQAVISRIENASVKASLETVVNIAKSLGAVVQIHFRTQEELMLRKPESKKTVMASSLISHQYKAKDWKMPVMTDKLISTITTFTINGLQNSNRRH